METRCRTQVFLGNVCYRNLACWVIATATPLAWSQYQLPQDGRLSEVNPQIGSGGRNYQAAPPPLLGNASTSGNLSSGLSFRGYSAIPNANSFRGPLGSSSLSAFRRDTTPISDSALPLGGLGARLYYDPATTVRSSGFLLPHQGDVQQTFTPGFTGGQLGSAGPVDSRLDPRLDSRFQNAPISNELPNYPVGDLRGVQGISIDPPLPGVQRSNMALYQRDTFQDIISYGAMPKFETAYSTPDTGYGFSPTAPANPLNADNAFSTGTPSAAPRANWAVDPGKPIDFSAIPAYQSDLNLTLRQRPTDVHVDPWLYENAAPSNQPGYAAAPTQQPAMQRPFTHDTNFDLSGIRTMPGDSAQQQSPYASNDRMAQVPGMIVAPSLPGGDLYGDMQIAAELQRDPRAPWFADMQDQVRADPTLANMLDERARLNSQEFVDRVMTQPIRSLATNSRTQINEAIAQAERLIDSGQYFDAVGRFEIAHALDPENPLPLLGKGHAQLAAGEFLSAAYNVLRALELYPDIAKFDLDLRELLGGGETVDIRRSQIMQRLEGKEEPRLRFLLGYLEYFSGYRERGLRNLMKAAEGDRTGSIIARFPELLQKSSVRQQTPTRGQQSPQSSRMNFPQEQPRGRESMRIGETSAYRASVDQNPGFESEWDAVRRARSGATTNSAGFPAGYTNRPWQSKEDRNAVPTPSSTAEPLPDGNVPSSESMSGPLPVRPRETSRPMSEPPARPRGLDIPKPKPVQLDPK